MNRIKLLRERYGIGQKKLAIELKLSQPTISDWETGRKVPSSKSTQKLADYFDVSIDYLLGRADFDVQAPVEIQKRTFSHHVEPEQLARVYDSLDDCFALRVRGSSMAPRMLDGDVVIVQKQRDIENGSTMLFLLDQSEVLLRRVKLQSAGVLLIPVNPAYDPLYYPSHNIPSPSIMILGRVIELRALL